MTQVDKEKEKKDEVIIPDFTEMWKEMYFTNEAAIAEIFREFISTQTFVGFINKTLEQNLSYEKVMRETIDKYMELSPVPSKKDISRVAELVISLEEKVDEMEYQFSQTMDTMTDILTKMADHQVKVKEEVISLGERLNKVEKKMETINRKMNALNKEKAPAKKKASKTAKKDEKGKDDQ